MSDKGRKPWLRRKLEPAAAAISPGGPDAVTFLSLAVSILAGTLLFLAYDHPLLAWAVIPFLLARLVGETLNDIIAEQNPVQPTSAVLHDLGARLSDVVIFLGITLSPLVDKVLGLLAIICVLTVSYVGVLGQAVTRERVSVGVLSKSRRMILLAVACLAYGFSPHFTFHGFSVFALLFLAFIPLASITLLERLDRIVSLIGQRSRRN